MLLPNISSCGKGSLVSAETEVANLFFQEK